MNKLTYEDAGTLAQAEFLNRLEEKISGRSEEERYYFFEKLYREMKKIEIEDNSGYVSLALQEVKKKAREINRLSIPEVA